MRMNKSAIPIISIMLCLSTAVNAQTEAHPQAFTSAHEQQAGDTIGLPMLTEKYYQDVSFLKQSYDYNNANKARQLKMWSRDIQMIGVATSLAFIFANAYLAEKNNWPLWIDIPCATAGVAAIAYPFTIWSNHLQKKAEAISTQTSYIYHVNDHWDVGAVRFTNGQGMPYDAIGIGIKATF